MKTATITFLAILTASCCALGQTISENDVPSIVKEAYHNSIGFPVVEWVKLTVPNGVRYVAVTKQLNPSSAKTLEYRYRYNGDGKLTSSSQYRGTGKGEGADFFMVYLGSGNPGFEKKIAKLVSENEVVSFEAFDFVPANQFEKFITTHRFVLKDKTGNVSVLYFDHEGKTVDISWYPVRKSEAGEKDRR